MQPLLRQKSLRFKLQFSAKNNLSAHAGFVLVHEALKKLGLIDLMKNFSLKRSGFADEVVLQALIQLLAHGGQSLSDWDYLRHEKGFVLMMGNLAPADDTLYRYLKLLSLQVLERSSQCGQVGFCLELDLLQQKLVHDAWLQKGSPKVLTLDLDAMLIETDKRDALFCYESYKAYHPLNAYCPELEMLLAHEFRDGNVSPMEGLKRLVERCQKLLPQVRFRVRSDSAGYQNEFLDWLDSQGIAYTITVRETVALQENLKLTHDWQPLKIDGFDLGEEVALCLHVPTFQNQDQLNQRMDRRRYLALRKTHGQQELFSLGQVVVTNDLQSSPEKIVKFHRGRCGSVEYFHSQIKDSGASHLPSNSFAVNAAWYSLVCLTHNLLRFIQHNLLPDHLQKIELKTLRFRLLNQAVLVIKKARSLTVRFCQNAKAFQDYCFAWQKLAHLNL